MHSSASSPQVHKTMMMCFVRTLKFSRPLFLMFANTHPAAFSLFFQHQVNLLFFNNNNCCSIKNFFLVFFTVDILSYVAMKLSGFPPNRVIGLGTFLDSCRFQYFIAQKLGVSPSSVQALIVGATGTKSGINLLFNYF